MTPRESFRPSTPVRNGFISHPSDLYSFLFVNITFKQPIIYLVDTRLIVSVTCSLPYNVRLISISNMRVGKIYETQHHSVDTPISLILSFIYICINDDPSHKRFENGFDS